MAIFPNGGKLQQLKTALRLGARANKYRVIMDAPTVGLNSARVPTQTSGTLSVLDTLCKGGAIPSKTIGTIDVWTQGRKLVIAGDAAYEYAWQLTFWNTQDHELRTRFDAWLLWIDDVDSHSRGIIDEGQGNTPSPHQDYFAVNAQIHQLDTSDNRPLAKYEFYNIWPTGISSMDMADDTQDTVTEFTVDFAFSHWLRIPTQYEGTTAYDAMSTDNGDLSPNSSSAVPVNSTSPGVPPTVPVGGTNATVS